MQVAHWSALVPFVALLLVRPRKRKPWGYWLIAVGFAVSFAAEVVSLRLVDPWGVTAWYPGVQLAFIGYGLGSAFACAFALLLLALPISESALITFASAGVMWAGRNHELRYVLFAYCLVGTAFFLLFAADRIMPWWYGYQASRLVAYGLFIWRCCYDESARQ